MIEGGAETVIDAFLDVLGPDGLLAVPTFTYTTRRFDPQTEMSLTGGMTNALRLRPNAVRSWHPTHSVAAVGDGAAEIVADHHLKGGLDIDTPLDRIAQSGGWVLMLGATQITNSTVHVGEAHAHIPHMDVGFSPDFVRDAVVVLDDREIPVTLHNPPGCSRAFGAIEGPLRAMDAISDGTVGRAFTQLMRGADVIQATVDTLAHDPGALLCTDPRCYRCQQSRVVLGRTML
jgi:aminoglycoside 3-N-acetyltransferase